MVPTAWIYSIRIKLWSPQLHEHLRLHSTWHLNNKTYPLTPDLNWHQFLHLCVCASCTGYWIHITSRNKCLHHFVHANLYTTFPVYPFLITSTLHWIITNASTTDTTWPSYSLLCSPLIITLVLFIFVNPHVTYAVSIIHTISKWTIITHIIYLHTTMN